MNNKKLNTGKGRAAKKKEFFKKWADRPTKQELQELKDYYNELTADLSHEWALEKLDSERRCHFLMLVKISDYAIMGGSFAILTAFKMGYLYAKGKIELGLPDYELGKGGTEHEKD